MTDDEQIAYARVLAPAQAGQATGQRVAAPRKLTDEAAMAWLRNRVEALSELPAQYAECAYTHRRTEFRVFREHDRDIGAAVDRLLNDIREDRQRCIGPALLTWRIAPECERTVEGIAKLYCRLAFEPDLWGQP